MKKLLAFITASAMIALCAFGLTSCGENYPKATDFQIQWGIKQINSDYIVTPEPGKGYATVKYTNENYKSIMVYELNFIATDHFDKDAFADFLTNRYSDEFATKQDALDVVNANDIKLYLRMAGTGIQMTNGSSAYFEVQFHVGSSFYDLYEYANTYAEMENFEFESYEISYLKDSTNLVYIEYNAITGEYKIEE